MPISRGNMNRFQNKLTLWMLAFCLMLPVAISPVLAKGQASSSSSDATTKKSKKQAKRKAAGEKKAAAETTEAAAASVKSSGKKSSKRSKAARVALDRKSTRLNSSHTVISYAVFC